jgi:hypothetical protein
MRKGLTRRQVLFGLIGSCFGLTALRPAAARAAIAGPRARTVVVPTARHDSAALTTTYSYDPGARRLCQVTSPWVRD